MAAQNSVSARRIHGSCHCGNIAFVFDRPGTGDAIAVRACSCSFCVKHGGVWTSHPHGRVALRIGDPARAQRYRFGSETADFHICATCGAAPVVSCEIDGSGYAVVNANCFDDVDRAELAVSATDFDGEATADRLARRQQNWAPLDLVE